MLQGVIVGIVVAVCAGHVAWTLLPTTLARRLLRWPLPRPLAAALRRRIRGCGCGGCDHANAPSGRTRTQAQTLHWRPRKSR
jgi:hypothetical protein